MNLLDKESDSLFHAKQEVENFLKNLESELERQGITVPDFASRLGVSKTIVYKWFKGESIMSLDKYFKACDILGMKRKTELSNYENRISG